MLQAGGNAAKFIPKLLEQVAGKSAATDFAKQLNEEEIAGIWELAPAFEGKKRESFETMLLGMGLKKPAPSLPTHTDESAP
jgi:hypothetical protein